MNWQAIGALGELLGGMVVLASLVFLAVQIRRNTQALRMSASADTNRSFAAYTAMFMQPGISRVYRVGLASPGELDEDEPITFNAVMSTLFNFFGHVHNLRASGVASPNDQPMGAAALYVLRQPGGELWWSRFRVTYDDDFRGTVDSLLNDAAR